MTISVPDLHAIASLAYLDTRHNDEKQLAREVTSIIDMVNQLSQVDTEGVAPLFHPMDLHQPLRADAVTEEDCLQELAEIAPLFVDQLYRVPKVIESGK